jgi:hypothetical protein
VKVRYYPYSLPPATKGIKISDSRLTQIILVSFILLTAAGVFILPGRMRLAYPGLSFLVGAYLYFRNPALYLGFTWWIWFLTPWVRRMIDWRAGWAEPNTTLLAPFLVTGITFLTFAQHLNKFDRTYNLPFYLSSFGVFYGILIGFVSNGQNAVILATLNWFVPIFFGLHIAVGWRDYPKYRQMIQSTFLWGTVITGVYGIIQYLVAPAWDRFWLENVFELGNTSFGRPEPFQIRVFSTLNSPGPFAIMIMAGVLMLTSLRWKGVLFSIIGYLNLLLTAVRAAWGGWILGILVVFAASKPRMRNRMAVGFIILVTCIVVIATIEPFSSIILNRVETLGDIQEDGSYQARVAEYLKILDASLFEFVGNGLGYEKDGLRVGFDSGILDLFVLLGWIGTLPYLGGLLIMLISLPKFVERHFDAVAVAALAISLSVFSQVILGNVFIGINGVFLWGFLGLLICAYRYYSHPSIALSNPIEAE